MDKWTKDKLRVKMSKLLKAAPWRKVKELCMMGPAQTASRKLFMRFVLTIKWRAFTKQRVSTYTSSYCGCTACSLKIKKEASETRIDQE